MRTLIQFLAGRDGSDTGKPAGINIIFAYDNVAAARSAEETLGRLHQQVADGAEPRLSPWSFSTLESPAYRAEATAAAVQADVIVVAISNRIRFLPVSVENWLRSCLARQRKTTPVVVAVFGCPDLPDKADSPRLQAVERLARDAGCRFFAPWSEEEAENLPQDEAPPHVVARDRPLVAAAETEPSLGLAWPATC